MSDENTLRKKAREAMQAGKLPSRFPQRMWGGPGVGACCTICGKPAGHDEAEYELEFTQEDDDRDLGSHHVHLQCFAAWEHERTNFEPAGATVASSNRSVSETRPSPGTEAKATALSGSLPASSNHRMITVHECDGTEERGSG